MEDSAELWHSYQYLEAQTSSWFYSYFWKASLRMWNALVESNVLDSPAGASALMAPCCIQPADVMERGATALSSVRQLAGCVGAWSSFNAIVCHQ